MKINKYPTLALAIALTLSACGGPETAEAAAPVEVDESQAQIKELQAQVDGLTELVEDQQTTTTAPADAEAAEPVVEEEPVAEPAVEAKETVVTEPPAAESVEVAAVDGFAVATGSGFNAAMGPAEVNALLTDMTGPTDNVAGEFARIAPFPALTTLPDSSVIGVSYRLTLDPGETDPLLIFEMSVYEAEFRTSALPQDVVVAYLAELSFLVGGSSSSGVAEQDNVEFHWAVIGDYSVTAYQFEGQTFVSVEHSVVESPTLAQVDAFSGLVSASSAGADVAVDRLSFARSFAMNQITVDFYTPDASDAEMAAFEQQVATDSGWTVSRDLGSSVQYSEPGSDATITTRAGLDGLVVEYRY